MNWRVGVVFGALACATATSMAQEAPPTETPPAEGSAAEPAPTDPPPAEPPPEPAPVEPTPAPAPVEPTPAIEAGYPQAYGARPLALPDQAFEATGALAYANSDFISITTLGLLGRIALGQIELHGGVGIYVTDDSDLPPGTTFEPERWQSALVGVRYAIDPNLMVGAALTLSTPTGDAKSYVPQASVTNRRHLAPGSTLDLTAAVGLNHFTGIEDSMGGGIPSSTQFVLAGEARVIAQAAPSFALEGVGRLGISRANEENMFMSSQSVVAYSYGVHAILSASPALDISLGLDVYSPESETLTVSVIGRRLP